MDTSGLDASGRSRVSVDMKFAVEFGMGVPTGSNEKIVKHSPIPKPSSIQSVEVPIEQHTEPANAVLDQSPPCDLVGIWSTRFFSP